MALELTTLFVPIGLAGLRPVVASDGQVLPTAEDGVFVAMTLEAGHAQALAHEGALDASRGLASFVLRFELLTAFLQKLEPRVVGRGREVELRVPSAALPAFSRWIVSPIQIECAFFGPRYKGPVFPHRSRDGDDLALFLAALESSPVLEDSLGWMGAPLPISGFRREPRKAIPARDELRRELLRESRFWLLANLGFWRAARRLSARRYHDLVEMLRAEFPHPDPRYGAALAG
jgi:hypothetical protein